MVELRNSRRMTEDQQMSEKEFKHELLHSIIVLSTSSPDKRDIYRLLFSELGKDDEHYAGLNAYFTDSGSLGIATRKTTEMTNDYDGNLGEKRDQQLKVLEDPGINELIGLKLHAVPNKLWGEDGIKVMGMTEDSGWQLVFEDAQTEKAFIDIIVRDLAPKLRPQDSWLLEKLHKTGFPGPNLKPLQEHLEGGFPELMQMIYKASDELGIKELRFTNTTNISFVSPRHGKYFPIKQESHGRLLTAEEYHSRLENVENGMAINSNFVHIPDGQKPGEAHTVGELIRMGLHTRSSTDLPADYARRTVTEYLQSLTGKRKSSVEERKRAVRIAYLTPDQMDDAKAETEITMPKINDLLTVGLPTRQEMVHYPNLKQFDHADVIVLMPKEFEKSKDVLQSDPNLRMVLNTLVTVETDPESMGVPVVLDNRSGKFNDVLALLGDAFAKGNTMGDLPLYIVNSNAEMKRVLNEIKDVRQRTPIIKKHHEKVHKVSYKPNIGSVPNDGTYTVFIGGGHATNSTRDLTDAKNLGYLCAEKGWRIVTGAGSVEGGMGSVHTGFIQYHLDQIEKSEGNEYFKGQFTRYLDENGHVDAEKMILKNPRLIDEMAGEGLIPRDMFYGYSMVPLLEMESPSGNPPPGITYFEAGNRFRRLQGLLDTGTKVFMPGGFGTYEELEETIVQHLRATEMKAQTGSANNNAFTDGTPDDQGNIVIYNRNGNVDKLLDHYGLLGDSEQAVKMRKDNNIVVISSLESLKDTSIALASSWKERLDAQRQAGKDDPVLGIAV